MANSYDTLHMGRSSIDLYSNDVGAPFAEITNFAAYVGGSPTNISVGAARLGLKSALLTAVGDDPVGDFILRFLNSENVDSSFIVRKPGRRSSAVLLGIEPPDRFPLTFYRDNCADIELTIDDVLAAPLTRCRAFQFAGTNLSREPSRSATFFAVEQARKAGAEIVFDIDFRPDQWHDPRAFGVMARAIMPLADIVIGTEDEINAVMLADPKQLTLTHSQVSDTKVAGDIGAGIAHILQAGPRALLQKLGADGLRIHLKDDQRSVKLIDCAGFPVEVQNILGAGDAFAAGFLAGRLTGRSWYESGRMATACGAIVVTKHGCANFMPTEKELFDFVDSHGGL